MKRILIADDDTAILELLNYHFKNAGFNVSLAIDGEEALKLAQKISLTYYYLI